MPYTVTPTAIPDVLVLEPQVFGDARGFFFESFNQRDFAEKTSVDLPFVQDNHSKSAQGVLRGLHYQIQNPQGKLVRVVQGQVFDAVVDLRQSSATFGQWVGVYLDAQNTSSCGCPRVLRTVLWCSVKRLNFCTKPPITGTPPTSAACAGTILRWALTGP